MVTIDIATNFTRNAQHVTLHPAGIALPSRWCFWFPVKDRGCSVWWKGWNGIGVISGSCRAGNGQPGI